MLPAPDLRLPAAAAHLAVLGLGAFFVVAVLRTGWLSDDAFIAIRSVDHLVNGRGFVLNLGQRVQSFTSPLWTLLCVPFFWLTQSPYAALMAPSVLCSVALAVVLARGQRAHPWRAAATLTALCASSSFLSFSTAGLENSLAHVLGALFCLERSKNGTRPTLAVFFLASGLFLTRFDYAALVAPSIATVLMLEPKRSLRLAWPALALVFAWFAFATVYYGFPLPNTAYAKLNTEIPWADRVLQGLAYLADAAVRDPVSWIVLLAALGLGLRRRVALASRLLLLGVALYVAYVVAIGGDFMGGRFLTTCFLMATLVSVELIELHENVLPVAAAGGLLLAILGLSDHRTDRTSTECRPPLSGIVDERECYVEHTGLTQNLRVQKWKEHGYLADLRKALTKNEERVVVWNSIGMAPYGAPREVHLVEEFSLSEPLLARIRFAPGQEWRTGHYRRSIPPGYLESLRSGQNRLKGRCLHDLYDRLALATRGDLWTWPRLQAIWELNTRHRTCKAPG
jgi:arabinofuranosyltransferase